MEAVLFLTRPHTPGNGTHHCHHREHLISLIITEREMSLI